MRALKRGCSLQRVEQTTATQRRRSNAAHRERPAHRATMGPHHQSRWGKDHMRLGCLNVRKMLLLMTWAAASATVKCLLCVRRTARAVFAITMGVGS